MVMAENTGGSVVPVFPAAIFPGKLLAERRQLAAGTGCAADTNQAVGDVAGRLDFEIMITRLVACAGCCPPYEVFRTVTAVSRTTRFGHIVIHPAGARIPAFQRRPVFKGTILGTPPNQVGTIFALIFGFVTGRPRFPDTLVGKADGARVFMPAHIGRATEFAANTAALIPDQIPMCTIQGPVCCPANILWFFVTATPFSTGRIIF